MPSLLANLLFKEYRKRVLSLLLLHPDNTYHVRELARLTETVPGTLHKELSKLAEAGILKKSSRGNQVSYQADRNCVIFEELSSIVRKTAGLADILADALAPLNDGIETAFVFGSAASGEAGNDSDIDLLIIGNASFTDIVKALHPTQETLGREINPKLFSAKEWQVAKKQHTAFIRDILQKPVISIQGEIDDTGEFTKGKPAAR